MTPSKPRLVMVNYLNTIPLLRGIREHLGDRVQILLANPAECARILIAGEADYGLIPVGGLIDQSGWRRVGNIGIGARGSVETVCLFGQQPFEEWKRIYLDHHSRTSVLLTRYLIKVYWRSNVELVPAQKGFEQHLGAHEGGLIIGDRAIEAKKRYSYAYDLGRIWTEQTGLPFVFAVWVSFSPEDPVFERELEVAMESGLSMKDAIIREQKSHYPEFDLERYFHQAIHYKLDASMLRGMEFFIRCSRELEGDVIT